MSRFLWKLPVLIVLCAALFACADPYDRELPASSLVAPGQAQRLSEGLSGDDRAAFLKWAERMQSPEKRFPGEEVPRTVAIALIYQRRYEQFEKTRMQETAREAQLAAVAREQAIELERAREQVRVQKSAAANAISQFVKVGIERFYQEPVYGARGIAIGRRWAFVLNISNHSAKTITGLRGELELTDSFGDNARYYGGQLDLTVPPKSTTPYTVTVLDEERSPLHEAMRAGGQIRYEWLIHSVAFADGSTMDYRSIASAPN